MFWRIPNFSASSPVESILDKEVFTLEELLDEEEIIQECKALNTRLINFLRDRVQVEQLLRYIVEDAPADAESKLAFKFPFIACEIFTCEIDVILKTLVEDDQLMDILFSFLDPNRTHSMLLAGYFSKVVVCLMLRKTAPLMNYVQNHDSIFRQLIDLIGITSIMEILVRLVGADDHVYPNFLDVMQWLADSNLLDMIIDKLSPSSSPEVQANAAEVLWAIIRNAPSALAAKLTSPSFVSRIFSLALEDTPIKSSLVHSLSVCIFLLDPKKSTSAAHIHSIRSQHLYEPSIPVDPETIAAMLPKLVDLLRLLDVSSDAGVLPTTYGELRPPLGKHRLKIVEFIAVLLGTGDVTAEKELISCGAIRRALDLFFQYPFNNFLHHHVESIILSCLDSKNVEIVDHLFCDCNIIMKLIQADRNNLLSEDLSPLMVPAAVGKSPRVGYIGHITRIANKLVQVANVNTRIRTYLQENSEWVDWQSGVLHERNTVENVYRWACGRPTALQERPPDSDEEDLHDRDYDLPSSANDITHAFRYNIYENEDADEDVYYDDDSAEVVISSLSLGDDHGSGNSLFTNSNWFAFQEDGNNDEPLSTSTIDRMEDVNINGTSSGDEESDEVVVGEDELATCASQNEFSGSDQNSVNNTSADGSINQQTTDSKNVSGSDDAELFRFETAGNDDLFSDQQLPDWVGWREPSDIHVDGPSNDLSALDSVEPGVSALPNDATETLSNGNLPSTSESGFPPKTEGSASSLFEDAEFVGVELDSGTGRTSERSLQGSLNEEMVAANKMKDMQKPGMDGHGILEFCDKKNHWRVEPEVGIVQE